MSDQTELDRLHAAMAAAPGDEAPRRAFYSALAASLLHVPLAGEPAPGAAPAPRLFDLDEGPVALAFDGEARLAAFIDGPSAYAALPGRELARLLAARGAGLLINAEAPSAVLLPAAAVAWLAEALAGIAPPAEVAVPAVLSPPPPLAPALVGALEARLARAGGLARRALLAGAGQGEARRPLLVFIDAVPGAERALAATVAEALHVAGIDAGTLDIAFVAGSAPAAGRLSRVGLGVDLPAAEEAASPVPPAPPGSGPMPPRLV